MVSCPVCSANHTHSVRSVFDDRYGCPGLFELVRCMSCNHMMTSPRLAEEDLGELYSTYYPRKQIRTQDLVIEASRVTGLAGRLRRWWEGTDNQGQYLVKAGQTVLDVGCGSGLSLLEAKALGGQAYGIEADPNIHRIAEELGLRVAIGNLYENPFPGVSFDLIVLNQVIEHIPEPSFALEAIRKRLKPGGRVILAFPNRNALSRFVARERWIHWHIPYHLHHFDYPHFRKMAERLGYRVVSSRTVTPNIWTILQVRAFGHQPVRGLSNPMWVVVSSPEGRGEDEGSEPTFLNPGLLRRVKRMLRLVASHGVALCNRLIDLARMGDSIVIVLSAEKV